MFREMRRKKQILAAEECIEILEKRTSGVLAVSGDDDYPYAVPLSYVYRDGRIYFHSALSGHKIDAINKHNKVSFCVIDKDEIVPEKFTTYFRSVIVFGNASIIDNDDEKLQAIECLACKYSPKQSEEELKHEIQKGFRHMHIIRITIEHITGKEAIELSRARKQ
jgi:nitroimidazol reductase NimA-like FMN-containing flavoprotein (pyridoxamine 5'-phosphate oxidase superfamily)